MTDQGPRGEQGDTGATGGVGATGATGARGAEGAPGAGMATPESVKDVLLQLRRLLLAIAVFAVIAIGYSIWQSYDGRDDLVKRQRTACERNKDDRSANARAWTAHAKYIKTVTGAASVREDVKRAAREALVTYAEVSAELTERAKLVCSDAYPSASLLP